jgi:transcription factor E2F7/8
MAAQCKEYSRKKKSLGILAENFLNSYQNMPPGSTIVVDEAAVRLGVERRRIYDVVNILEAICLVSKKHKNTYSWLGKESLDGVFGRLQASAIQEYPQDAQRFGLEGCNGGDGDGNTNTTVPLKPPRKQNSTTTTTSSTATSTSTTTSTSTRENKSLAKLSQEFLQVFLVGHVTLSLPEASDKIQGTTSVEELIAMGGQTITTSGENNHTTAANANTNADANAKELKAAAARGLKTKIRRLYDIANVFLSVGLLEKVDSGDSSRRPNFSWSYRLSAFEIHQLHNQHQHTTNTNTTATATKQVQQQVVVKTNNGNTTNTSTTAAATQHAVVAPVVVTQPEEQ